MEGGTEEEIRNKDLMAPCGFRNSMVPADGESLKGLPMLIFRTAIRLTHQFL